MATGLVKNISMGGSGWFHSGPAYTNSVLYADNYVNNPAVLYYSGALTVSVWVDWWQFQGEESSNWPVPTNYAQSWQQLEAQNSKWALLDQEIATLIMGGKYPIIRFYHRSPKWARYQGTPPAARLKPEHALPVNTAVDGPWAWFVAYVMCRYKYGVPQNGRGPHYPSAGESVNAAFYGNPSGAWTWGLAPMNEINLVCWGYRNRAEQTAEMIRTADAYAAAFGSPLVLFVPEMSDVPRKSLDGSENVPEGSYPYDTYAAGLLTNLQGWVPSSVVVWSHHNYFDVKYRSQPGESYTVSHAWDIRAQLYAKAWKGASADRYIYISEGTYDIYAEIVAGRPEAEAANEQRYWSERNFQNMKAMPDVVMFSTHTIRDGGTFWSGLYTVGGQRRDWGAVFPGLS